MKELLHAQKIDLTFSSHLDERYEFERRFAFSDRLLLAVPAHEVANLGAAGFALSAREVRNGVHLSGDCSAIDLKLFCATPFILLEKKYNLRRRTDAFFAASGLSPVVCLEVAQIVTAIALSRAGLGTVFLPDRAVSANDGACFYKISSPGAMRRMDLVTNSKSYLPHAVRRFIEVLASCYSSNADDPM